MCVLPYLPQLKSELPNSGSKYGWLSISIVVLSVCVCCVSQLPSCAFPEIPDGFMQALMLAIGCLQAAQIPGLHSIAGCVYLVKFHYRLSAFFVSQFVLGSRGPARCVLGDDAFMATEESIAFDRMAMDNCSLMGAVVHSRTTLLGGYLVSTPSLEVSMLCQIVHDFGMFCPELQSCILSR